VALLSERNHLARIRSAGRWLVLLLSLLAALPAQNGTSMPEDEIKAAFLFSFAKFIEWPARVGDDALVMVVLARDSFASTLERTVRGKTVNGRPLIVKRLAKPQEARGCHVVFIGGGDQTRSRPILDALPVVGVLTVGEAEQFAVRGGVITFVKDANRLRFEINVDAAGRAGLRISSRLLQLARVVHDEVVER